MKVLRDRLCAVGILLANPGALAADDLPPAERLLRSERPLVIAHRGFSAAAPENTTVAFRLALAAAADLVELDYHHSADGVPIVIHDATLDRTTDAVARSGRTNHPVRGYGASDLDAFDAGRWFSLDFAGQRLPRLVEALEVIQAGGVALIERKGGDAATCLRLLRERGWINRAVVQSFDWAYLEDFHRQAPEQVLGALGPPGERDGRKLTDEEKMLATHWLDGLARTGARLVVWNRLVDRPSVAEAHRRGLRVWIYTINEASVANQLLDLGVDGMITDNPAQLWRTLALRGVSLSNKH